MNLVYVNLCFAHVAHDYHTEGRRRLWNMIITQKEGEDFGI